MADLPDRSTSAQPETKSITSTSKTKATPSGVSGTRSRTGCVECRRLRRKCDEARPHCLACVNANKQCSYNKPLQWGGRAFKKSAFGQAVGAGVGIIVQEPPSPSAKLHRTDVAPAFVYGPIINSKKTKNDGKKQFSRSSDSTAMTLSSTACWTPSSSSSSSSSPSSTSDSPERTKDDEDVAEFVLGSVPLHAQINWLSWLSDQHRYLVHHFMTRQIKQFSLHPSMHAAFCSTLAPFALDKTRGIHLLSAILVSSAKHRKALGHAYEDSRIEKLTALSVGQLARQKIGQDPTLNQVAAATALVLCLTEIQAGGEKPNTWKIHLQGAKAILHNTVLMTEAAGQPPSPTLRFLRNWCQSLDIMSLSAGRPHEASTLLNPATTGYIDMFEGYSTALIPIFQEMADLFRSRLAIQELEGTPGSENALAVLRESWASRGRRIDFQIGQMATQPRPVLDLSQRVVTEPCMDFQALNEAYHHSARLEIRHNTLQLPMNDPETVDIVKAGIACLKRMDLGGGNASCKTLHVAFSLGQAAYHENDREFVVEWLDRLRSEFGMENVVRAKELLLEHWSRCDGGQPYIRPRALSHMRGWELILA